MEKYTREELYRAFTDCVLKESQSERSRVNRRMFSVFLWCFVLPALVTASFMVLIRFNALPVIARRHLDWIALLFPVGYSLYFLSAEVIRDLPRAVRWGGLGNTLHQFNQDAAWRLRTSQVLKSTVPASAEDWGWITVQFRVDLENHLHRAKYLTALAGAVFFLIMEGIDSIALPPSAPPANQGVWFLGLIENSTNAVSEWVGLILFLVLLYLSGVQTYYFLKRYLNCAELIEREIRKDRSS